MLVVAGAQGRSVGRSDLRPGGCRRARGRGERTRRGLDVEGRGGGTGGGGPVSRFGGAARVASGAVVQELALAAGVPPVQRRGRPSGTRGS